MHLIILTLFLFMIKTTRILSFDAAHRVIGHQNKCQNLHGHRFEIEASFVSEELDDLGMVIDFGIIKKILGNWIDENWDHNTILYSEDHDLGLHIEKITRQKVFYLPNNPTAENMALYLLHKICPIIFADYKIICSKIKLYETPNCYCEASLG